MSPTRPGPASGCRPALLLAASLALSMACTGVPASTASSAEPAPPPPAQTRDTAAEATPRFDIELQGPEGIRRFLLQHMKLQRYRFLEDLSAAELDRLLDEVADDLGQLLGTLGYFSAQIDVTLDVSVADRAGHLGVVRMTVIPGEPTRIASQRVYLRGDIADNPAAAEQRKAIERAATLPADSTFTQGGWEQAKTQALRQLTQERYPNGRLLNSLADIDAQARQAHLYMELDSGPMRRLGEIQVLGAERYDAAQAERLASLAGIEPGQPYSLSQLQAAQARIAASGRYASVLVTVDPGDPEGDLPVVVQLREQLRQRLQIGLGGSTDNGPRLSLEYTHRQVPFLDWQSDNRVQLERQDRLAQTVWTSPMDARGWRWATSARWAEQIDDFTTTTSQRLRWGRSQEEPAQDQGQYLQFDRARTVGTAGTDLTRERSRSALSVNQSWTWRRFSDPVFPQYGQGLALELGLGTTLEGTPKPFLRTQTRWLTFWPLDSQTKQSQPDRTDSAQRLGRLAFRLEGGAVAAGRSAQLPDTLLFLTGGDASVRGYGLREIGIPLPTGGVSPGRYMAVASLEWQRPLWRDGVRSAWEHVVFIDGGAVADKARELRAQWGVGSGVRYNSPAGPLQLDLAYGRESRDWRLHLSVGFAF